MTETKLRDDICRFGRSLFERGLTPGSSGNISVRLADGGWLVTPTNASLGFLDPAMISRLDAQGHLVSGDAPTKEMPLHSALYATRSNARAIVHLHSTHAVALSMLREIDPRAVVPPMTAYYVMRAGRLRSCRISVPVIPPSSMRSAVLPAAIPPCCSPITARWSQAKPWKRPYSLLRNSRRPPNSICCCAA